MTQAALATPAKPSHLFYQTKQRRPLIERAEGIYIWAKDGRRFIDGSSGAMVANIGHGNPRVLAAMRDQMERATFAYRLHFENEAAEELASAFCAELNSEMDRVFFVSGGSEAVESCLKLARQYALAIGEAGRWKVISRFPSYHGCTLGALAITGYTPLTEPFTPMMQAMPQIAAPRSYLDRDNLTDEERGLRYADLLEAEIERQGPESVLAFIMEPIGGAATGALVAPDSYYARIREICDRYGVLLIYDEVMSGIARTGRFLGGDHWPARPDLIAVSKGFAAGYAPLGAMIAPSRLVEPVLATGGFLHGFTYAGNPLACAAGRAVLAEIKRQDLVAQAALRGTRLKAGLDALKGRFPFIGDVRGLGLLLAVELVADRGSMAPLPPAWQAHARLVELAYDRGLIIYSRRTRGGLEGDHVMVCPPMIITEAEIDRILQLLGDSLGALAQELGLDTA
ncbi:MAG: aspartate aminotransferase family protein [Pseudomonadota bacterium]